MGSRAWCTTTTPTGRLVNAGGWGRRVDPYETGFVDLPGDQGLLGQRESRTSHAVIDWPQQQSQQFRGDSVRGHEPAAVYAKAVRGRDEQGQLLLPNARLVVNHFHLVKLANDCVPKVRRR